MVRSAHNSESDDLRSLDAQTVWSANDGETGVRRNVTAGDRLELIMIVIILLSVLTLWEPRLLD